MNYLKLNKEWRLEQRDNELYILGGQDAIFTIDLENKKTSFFANLNHNQKFTAQELRSEDKIVLEQLLSASVIIPLLAVKESKKPFIKISNNRGVVLQLTLEEDSYTTTKNNEYDLLILVRTEGTLKEFLEKQKYSQLSKPHIFVDLAYNHTVSVGPLVFPGITSCIACLEGRISIRWGDDLPPPKPKGVDALVGLAKEWLSIELNKIFIEEDYSLVNKTVVIDTQNRTLDVNKLLTVPLCPYCKKSKLLPNGRLEYTFAKA